MEPEIVSDHNLILKRKRSQRQRPSGNSFSSSDDGCPTPEELLLLSSSTEDQEVAECLILLAQGEYQADCNSPLPVEMLSSSKPWLDRKIHGFRGVYECKTCDRSFHSFQALGGHRAKHKKLKSTTTNEPLLQKSASRSPDNNSCHNLNPLPPIPTLQLGNNRAAGKIRVHQCVICCAEFPSGQALGGHMRKHRVILPLNSPLQTHTSTADTTTSAEDGLNINLSLSSPASEEAGIETSRSKNEFQCLDLNLPAASSSEDEISETKFSFPTLQDSGLVLSGPALVDCHY